VTVTLTTRPRLAARARLREEPRRERTVLLAPEEVIVLNPSAAATLALCGDGRAVDTIVEDLRSRVDPGRRDAVEGDVLRLLQALADRGLVVEAP
jgi:pyrroloquinoline quinone biosynthesis protein D